MDEDKFSAEECGMVIRFNPVYTAVLFTTATILIVIFLTGIGKKWDNYFLILSIILMIHGIYTLLRNKYVRLDKKNKTVKVYDTPVFWARKYKYDRLFFTDKKLYSEIEGKTEFINIQRFQCRNEDFEALIEEVNKGV